MFGLRNHSLTQLLENRTVVGRRVVTHGNCLRWLEAFNPPLRHEEQSRHRKHVNSDDSDSTKDTAHRETPASPAAPARLDRSGRKVQFRHDPILTPLWDEALDRCLTTLGTCRACASRSTEVCDEGATPNTS